MYDGWKNKVTNVKNFAGLIKKHDDGKLIFLGSEDYSEISENSENMLATHRERFESQALTENNCIINSVISDNASPMVKFGNDSGLIAYTCQAHTGNLLLKDCYNENVGGKVRQIQVAFRNVFLENTLSKLSGKCIYLAGDTRWKGELDEFKNLLHQRPFMVQVAAEHPDKVNDDVKKLLHDAKFLRKVMKQVDKLEPVGEFIDFVQSDSCYLADGVDKIYELQLHKYKECDERRLNMLIPKVAKLSYLMHPKYKGERFDEKTKTSVKSLLISHLSVEEFDALGDYIEHKGYFSSDEASFLDDLSESESPLVYWRCVEMKYPSLAKIGLQYSPLPSSTAALERAFGYWGRLHSTIRNRIKQSNSEKLIYCFYSLTHNEAEIVGV